MEIGEIGRSAQEQAGEIVSRYAGGDSEGGGASGTSLTSASPTLLFVLPLPKPAQDAIAALQPSAAQGGGGAGVDAKVIAERVYKLMYQELSHDLERGAGLTRR